MIEAKVNKGKVEVKAEGKGIDLIVETLFLAKELITKTCQGDKLLEKATLNALSEAIFE